MCMLLTCIVHICGANWMEVRQNEYHALEIEILILFAQMNTCQSGSACLVGNTVERVCYRWSTREVWVQCVVMDGL